jgi:hypothetical protein
VSAGVPRRSFAAAMEPCCVARSIAEPPATITDEDVSRFGVGYGPSLRERTMADIEKPSTIVRSMMAENLEQARSAMTNYFQFVEKSMSASPLAATDQAKGFRSYIERSVAASFQLSDKLLRAKDFQDILRIQSEFFQTQLRALTEQSKDLETASEATPEVTRIPIK